MILRNSVVTRRRLIDRYTLDEALNLGANHVASMYELAPLVSKLGGIVRSSCRNLSNATLPVTCSGATCSLHAVGLGNERKKTLEQKNMS